MICFSAARGPRTYSPAPLAICAALVLAACQAPLAPQLPSPNRGDIARLAPSLGDSAFGTATNTAILQHPSLTAGTARIDAAIAGVGAARSAALPQISLGADLSSNLLDGSAAARSFPVLAVTQLLFDAGATKNRIRAAEATAIRETIERENTAATLALTAAEAWADVQYRRSSLEFAQQNVQAHADYLQQIEARADAGVGVDADVLAARSRTADADMRAITAQGELDRAEARFAEMFNTPAPATLAPLPRAPVLPGVPDADVVNISPRIRSLDAEIAAAQAGAEAARRARLPAFELQASASRNASTGEERAAAGISPRVSVGPGGGQAAIVARSLARVVELQSERETLQRQILRSLAFLRSDQRSATARVDAAALAVQANEANVTAARQQFTIARRTAIQVLDAQRDLFTANEALTLAQRDLALSGYSVLALTGDILDALGLVLPARQEVVKAAE